MLSKEAHLLQLMKRFVKLDKNAFMTERIDSLFFLKLGFFVKSLHFTKK